LAPNTPITPILNNRSAVRRRARQNKSSGRTADTNLMLDLIQDATNSAIGDIQVVKTDMLQKKYSYLLTQTPPRSFRSMIFWCKTMFSYTANISTTPAINENNITFSLNNANAPNLDFDQYCIYEVGVNFSPVLGLPPVSGGYMGDVVTAIDYDNATALGSESQLLSYSTVNRHQSVVGKSLLRMVKPQVSAEIYQSAVATGYAPLRCWIDKANPAIPHYGLRTMTTNVAAAYQMEITLTFILGFRNTT